MLVIILIEGTMLCQVILYSWIAPWMTPLMFCGEGVLSLSDIESMFYSEGGGPSIVRHRKYVLF